MHHHYMKVENMHMRDRLIGIRHSPDPEVHPSMKKRSMPGVLEVP